MQAASQFLTDRRRIRLTWILVSFFKLREPVISNIICFDSLLLPAIEVTTPETDLPIIIRFTSIVSSTIFSRGRHHQSLNGNGGQGVRVKVNKTPFCKSISHVLTLSFHLKAQKGRKS